MSVDVDKQAVLTPGTYAIEGSIVVPKGARLVGDVSYPTIRLTANPGGAAQLVRFTGSGGRVGFVRLDAANRLVLGCCSAVVIFTGSGNNNLLDDTFVTGAPETAPLHCGIGGRVELCQARGQIAWASSVNAAATRVAGGESTASS